jgi:3-oxoadipate CoA-transferase, alpha subunit
MGRHDQKMINKIVNSFDEAVKDIFDGAVILCGGFSDVGGNPGYLFQALTRTKAKDLTLVGNSPAIGKETMQTTAKLMKFPDWYADGEPLINSGRVKKLIVSTPQLGIVRVGETGLVKAIKEKQQIEIELVAQGTLAERIRAARAGIPAFYTPTGAGTFIAEGKDIKDINGIPCILEHALKGDFSFIRAHKADRYGNLIYKGTARSFNPTMAGASTVTIAEVDEIVELGELDPEVVITPGVYVDKVVARPH